MKRHVTAAAHANHMQIDTATGLNLVLVGFKHVDFYVFEHTCGRVFDDDCPTLVHPLQLVLFGVRLKRLGQRVFVYQGSPRHVGLAEFALQQTKEFHDHEEAVRFAVQSPLLRVLPGKAHVLVEIEAPYAAGVDTPGIEGFGQVLVQPGGRVTSGQTEHVLVFDRLLVADIGLHQTGGHLAHLVEVARHIDLKGHGLSSPSRGPF